MGPRWSPGRGSGCYTRSRDARGRRGAPQALSLPAPKGSPYFQSPAWPDHSREQNYFCWGRGEHTSYFKQLQTPGIWVSEFLNFLLPAYLSCTFLSKANQQESLDLRGTLAWSSAPGVLGSLLSGSLLLVILLPGPSLLQAPLSQSGSPG